MTPTVDTLIIVPVYNHGSTLANVVRGALSLGLATLVVDDGSDDNCLQTLGDLSCMTLRLERNCGKGAAILAGAKKATELGYDNIVTIDADGQHNPSDIPLLIEEADKHTSPVVVIGERRMVQSTIPRSSHFGKHFSNFWVRLECGCDLADTQSGFRLYPVKELLLLTLKSKRYDFEIETLVKMAWAGIAVVSTPVDVHYPPADKRISHFKKFTDNLRLSILHSQLVLRRLLPWPHKTLVEREPLQQKVKETLYTNPLKTLAEVCREHSSPFWLAFAVWLGIFMGALPLLACHTVAIIYVAHRLHINKVASVAASQFCMPPIVPVMCIQTGYFIRKGEFLFDLSWERWLLEIHERLYEWLIGSLLLGPLLGLLGAAAMYWAALRLHKRKNIRGV